MDNLTLNDIVFPHLKNMLIPYRTLIDVGFVRKLVKGTFYNWHHCPNLYIFAHQKVDGGQGTVDLDTDRVWNGVSIATVIDSISSLTSTPDPPSPVPLGIDTYYNSVHIQTLSTTYTPLAYLDESGVEIRALSSGGFRLRSYPSSDQFLTGFMARLTTLAGTSLSE